VGRQLTVAVGRRPAMFDAMLALARSPTSRVDLIAKGLKDGLARGWFYSGRRIISIGSPFRSNVAGRTARAPTTRKRDANQSSSLGPTRPPD